MVIKNVAAKPPKPYIRHKPQTLRERNSMLQAKWPCPACPRPETMMSLSKALTRGVSSGRLRNQGQNRTHQRIPNPVTIHSADFHPKRGNKTPRRSGTNAPPKRLDIQMSPWADARSCRVIQSVIIRDRDGNPPAWKMPKRKRKTHSTRNAA